MKISHELMQSPTWQQFMQGSFVRCSLGTLWDFKHACSWNSQEIAIFIHLILCGRSNIRVVQTAIEFFEDLMLIRSS